jgi:hypothetical protein
MSMVGLSARLSSSSELDIGRPAPSRIARCLGWLAAAGISSSALVMIGASLLRSGWMAPPMVLPTSGPPWEIQSVHVRVVVVTVALWLAAILGGAGVAAGLAAVRGGVRVKARYLLVPGLLVVAVLTVLLPVGSSDSLDYAAYGRMVVLGHSPYVMTPYQLRFLHDPLSRSVPAEWDHQVTLYGPLATTEQFLAAELGGTSVARIVFWLKLCNAVAFGAVALALHRVLRSDPAARLRAHLLWTINPLLAWGLIAAGHLDVLAAAAGVLGLLVLGARPADGLTFAGRRAISPGPLRAAAAGIAIGIAADIKIFYVLFGLGLAWALRRSPRALAAAVAGALAVLAPTYTWFGPPAIKALLARRDVTTVDNFYQLFSGAHGYVQLHVVLVAGLVVGCLAVLTLRRLPAGVLGSPAIRAALALSVSWLLVWPYQLPWYDAMIVCVLVLYPASRLDWLVLTRLTMGTIALMPGNAAPPTGQLLATIARISQLTVAPVVLLGVALGLVVLCLTGRWNLHLAGDDQPATARLRQVQRAASASSKPNSSNPVRT